MKFKLLLIALLVLALPGLTLGRQNNPLDKKPKPAAKPTPTPSKTEKPAASVAKKTDKKETATAGEAELAIDPSTDKDRFDAAVAAPTHSEKAALLKKFLEDFPDSELREEAVTYLVTARSVVGGERLQAGAPAEATESYRLAVAEAGRPIRDRLFTDVIARIPATLFDAGRRTEAADLAKLIESAAGDNVRQLLAMASFYLTVENSADAIRVAERAIELEPDSAAGHQALGFAHRLNFDLEAAATSFARAVEIDPTFAAAQRSLAEMKRALGSPDDAIAYYRTALVADEKDIAARSGLALALFDKGKKTEAEAELTKVLELDKRNYGLRAAAAYWYAANGDGQKAAELAQRAIDIEPRYVWSHIALARGLMKQGRPGEAERVLIRARQYGNFPTLEYEIASARMMAGFYREAAEELGKSFEVTDGMIRTKLGGRVERENASFIDLLANERRASILLPKAADDPAASVRLRTLFELSNAVEAKEHGAKIGRLADEFAGGDDNMAVHRKLHAAGLLLQKNLLVPKAADMIKSVVGLADKGLDVASPASAVMASELYESRAIAFARNEVLLIPDVSKQTLSAILRGRIEELAGWALFLEGDLSGSAVRLRRSISVVPDKSAWWRSSIWRLGATLEADGKHEEALDNYLKAYQPDRPNAIRYSIIAALYRRVKGSTEGLEEKIGPNPLVAITGPPQPAPTEAEKAGAKSEDTAETTTSADPEKKQVETEEVKKDAPANKPEEQKEVTKKNDPPADPKVVEKVEKQPIADPEKKETENVNAEKKVALKETDVAAEPEKKSSAKDNEEKKPVSDPPAEKKETVNDTEVAGETEKSKDDVSKGKFEEKTSPAEKEKDEAGPPKEAPALNAKKEVIESSEPSKTTPGPETLVSKNGENDTTKAVKKSADEEKAVVETLSEETRAGEKKTPNDPAVENKAKTDKDADDNSAEPVNLLRDPFQRTLPENKEAEKKDGPVTSTEKIEPESKLPTEKDTSVRPRPTVIITDGLAKNDKSTDVKANAAEPAETKSKGAADSSKDGDSGATRSRVVEGRDIVSDQKCNVEVSQSTISLVNSGGSLGILITVADEVTAKAIRATSSSTRDIEVTQEPAIAGVPGRRFFVIRSISERTGLYQVNFESPCGKNEISVRVR